MNNTLQKYFGAQYGGFNYYKETARDKYYNEVAKHMSKEQIEKELRQARTIFQKYDLDKSGHLGNSEVRPMMIDTYKAINNNYNPSPADVQKYIDMMDGDDDGQISLEEYEIFVLKALKNRNIKL